MYREKGPNNSLGFGVTQGQLPADEITEIADSDSSLVARALNERPVAKFFATAVATIVAAGVSGSLVRRGGVRALSSVARSAALNPDGRSAGFMKEYRKVQDIMDHYGGIHRTKQTARMDIEGGKVVHFDDPTLDVTRKGDSFIFNHGERERMRQIGGQVPAEWSLRDEMQQMMVRSARRLPYELPAVYVTQRTLTDRLLDEGPENPVNWRNPVDIIGDFAEQSAKNVAFAFAPFTAGGAGAKQLWRKGLTVPADSVPATGIKRSLQNALIDMDDSLSLIGEEAADLLAKGARVSGRSLGAMSTAISQTASKQQSIGQALNSLKHGEGGTAGWLQRIRQGEEVFGPVSQFKDIHRNYRAALANDNVLTTAYGGASKYEDIISSVKNLQGSPTSPGEFHQRILAAEYKKIVNRRLVDYGVDDGISQQFTDQARFMLPSSSPRPAHISNRVFFGKRHGGVVHEDTGAWSKAFEDRIEPVFTGHGNKIASKMEDVIRHADAEFLSLKPALDQKISVAWQKSLRDSVVPQIGHMLGTRKMPFAEFGQGMTADNAEFLVRRTAERLNIPTVTAMGQRISTADLKSHIGKYGFDPTNRQRMRSFLVEQGDISAPWNPAGRNFLGLRALSVQDGLDRKIFGQNAKEASELAEAISKTDWDPNILNRMRLGGVFETRSGGILDINPYLRGGRSALDKLATEIEVPVLGFNPLQMFGYGARSEAAQRGAIQFVAGGRQPFVGARAQDADGFFWFQARGSKGRVGALRMGDGMDTRVDMLEGTFRPFPVDQSMTGRALHLAAGSDMGRAAVAREGAMGAFADRAHLDPYQPSSLWGSIRRLSPEVRNDPIRSPAVFARAVQENRLPTSKAELADAGEGFLRYLRTSSISRNIAKITGRDSALHKATHLDGKSVLEMDAKTLRGHADRLMREAPEDIGISDKGLIAILNRAKNMHIKSTAGTENLRTFDQPLHPMARTATLNQRIDQQRMEMVRYLTIRQSAVDGVSPRDFRTNLNKMISEIGELQGAGRISSREAAEARAAVGSIQASHAGLRVDPLRSRQDKTISVINELIESRPGESVEGTLSQIVDDAANHGTSGKIAGKVKRFMAPGRYKFDGTEYNPFGTNVLLTPTFGTAFSRDPLRATLNAAGVGTWRDPEHFSGAGIPVTHIFERMNRATHVIGMGVDSAKYGGPLDMFHRGMIAKRALPLVAGGATAMTIDRTAGAYVYNERDEHGERVYKPLVMGQLGRAGVEIHAAAAGLTPGGMSYSEKRDELLYGDVAIRRGRWWPFGNTPWRGADIEYYRPSWYRRLEGGYQYTSQTYGTPMERLMFGYDFSPLRPLDPYRFERKNFDERPYPVTGEYFTGPWGPATSVLNMTVGRVLKPRHEMHQEELQQELARFQQVGAYGMAPPSTAMPIPGEPTIAGALMMGPGVAAAGAEAAAGTPAYVSGSPLARQNIFAESSHIAQFAKPWYTAPQQYPFDAGNMSSPSVMGPSNVMTAAAPMSPGDLSYQLAETGYRLEEWAGIYGFGFGALRETLGFGGANFEHDRPMLAQASTAYGTTRQFWDLNLGGLGDFPTPIQGMGSLELSELVRRFLPNPRSGNDWINPLRNQMGVRHPWLPADEYFTNFHTGDPYTEISEGEMRLPGIGYERFNQLHSDETGRYGRVDRFRILADVAPYSNEFRMAAAELRSSGMSSEEAEIYRETMRRVEERKQKKEFTPYEHKYEPGFGGAAEAWERFKHVDTYFHKKLLPDVTAIEDWERNHIFGSSFPEWQRPIESFVKPAIYKTTDKNPIRAGVGLAIFGQLFGATPRARAVGRLMGGAIGVGGSLFGSGYEALTGDRFLPADRRREMAIEEYTDILRYTRALRGFNLAEEMGDFRAAEQFRDQMKSTMYGVDLYDSSPEELEKALPKRKREHFRAFLDAPEQERGRILSTAGRLERRIYQAHWGMRVEKRPELEDYFAQHELPGPEWEGWDPRMDMNHVEIKMLQQQGLNASQMGYYPQQLKQARLINPSFPAFGQGTSNPRAELERLMSARGMSGDIRAIPTPFAGTRTQLYSGV